VARRKRSPSKVQLISQLDVLALESLEEVTDEVKVRVRVALEAVTDEVKVRGRGSPGRSPNPNLSQVTDEELLRCKPAALRQVIKPEP
jgi:hypothetical protein